VSGDVEVYDSFLMNGIDSVDMPQEHHLPTDTGEQALQKLREAAAVIASSERRPRRIPHASRLAPVYDISAEIQRDSTPMPRLAEDGGSASADVPEVDLPDLWPQFEGSDDDAPEGESWADYPDPLQSRHFPDSSEAARIEEEDMRRAVGVGAAPSAAHPTQEPRQVRRARMQHVLTGLSIFALLLLIGDGLLVSSSFLRHSSPAPVHAISSPPSLTLSLNTVYYGQSVTLYIRHFSPTSQVALTYDVGEALRLDSGKSSIQVGQNGAADVGMYIDTGWSPGAHTIAAEDLATHYTAHASLQVAAGKTHPAQLVLSTVQFDLGADIQGANTMQTLTLSNAGGTSISWSASSDQSWLLLTPAQGIFSDTQTIAIAGQRANLQPGDYKGQITFASNTGSSQVVQVKMSVRPIPANAGAVLAVVPPIFSFIALDGGFDPDAQFLTISNPGSQPLYWSLGKIVPSISGVDQSAPTGVAQSAWLGIDQTSGIVPPGGAGTVHVIVHSHSLLPGTYLSTLVLTTSKGYTALDPAQNISVSLSVQPSCGLVISAGNMSFTAVAGQNNPSSQVLSFTGTGICPGSDYWQATTSAPWLVVTPASGQLQAKTNAVLTVGIDASSLKPGTYLATITVITVQTTQSVPVQLTVQQAPSQAAPIMGASPLALNFGTTLGQNDPPGQVVTITNTGGSLLTWYPSVSNQATAWLMASSTGGTIAPGQSAQLSINVQAGQLAPGSYTGQVALYGIDAHNTVAAGSPQTITVNFVVQAPCTLSQPSSSTLAFTVMQAAANPAPQSVSISATGNCSWPATWNAKVAGAASWLHLSPTSGSFTSSGQSSKLVAAVNDAGLAPGTYQAQVSISALDASTQPAQGNPQMLTISLTVLQPCTLQTSPDALSFSLAQGQVAAAVQPLTFNEVGHCTRPLSWTVTTDAASASWLTVTPGSGTDSGVVNTISISASAAQLTPGTYKGMVVLVVNGSGGLGVQGSPLSIPVTLIVI